MSFLLRLAGFVARAAFAAATAAAVTRLVASSTAGGSGEDAPSRPSGATRDLGRMVKDPVCGVYLPVERALRVVRSGRELHFCGQPCADRYEAS